MNNCYKKHAFLQLTEVYMDSVAQNTIQQLSIQFIEVSIREVPVLDRCPYQRDVCIREVPVLERCIYQRSVCIREMYVLERCLYQRGVCIRLISCYYRAWTLRHMHWDLIPLCKCHAQVLLYIGILYQMTSFGLQLMKYCIIIIIIIIIKYIY